MLVLLIAICILSGVHATKLERMYDEPLLNLIRIEKYVIVLFTTSADCADCDNYEKKLAHLRKDLVDVISAWVVKAIDSEILDTYSNDKEPVLIFFRDGFPLMYEGSFEDEDIMLTFIENKEHIVREISDYTFEHLTQASTGATTGDWFVMFYSSDCDECFRLISKWHMVGARLKHKINLAHMNIDLTGISTARRFNITNTPEFIFFRHGKMYRYNTRKYDVASFIAFATEEYKDVKPEIVPPLPSFFDKYIKVSIFFLYDNPWMLKLASICIGVLVILATIKCTKSDEEEDKEDKD